MIHEQIVLLSQISESFTFPLMHLADGLGFKPLTLALPVPKPVWMILSWINPSSWVN